MRLVLHNSTYISLILYSLLIYHIIRSSNKWLFTLLEWKEPACVRYTWEIRSLPSIICNWPPLQGLSQTPDFWSSSTNDTEIDISEYSCPACVNVIVASRKLYVLGWELGLWSWGSEPQVGFGFWMLPWLGPRSDELTRCHNLAHGATASCISRPVLLCEMSTLFLVGFLWKLLFLHAGFNYNEKISRRQWQIIAQWLIEICHWIYEHVQKLPLKSVKNIFPAFRSMKSWVSLR